MITLSECHKKNFGWDGNMQPEHWWQGAVIYQIYPRSYQDSTGNGIGDLPGIITRLDYIKSLGVDAIWISPFYASPMDDFGYDVSDYRQVDPIFGTNDDADRLIAEAEKRGLGIVVDMVLSHTSDQHAWFQESASSRDNAKADWYVWHDGKPDPGDTRLPPNNWRSVFGGSAWQWHDGRGQFFLHNFVVSQPDLNLHNPHVQDALLGEVEYWLKKGVKGLRLDAINFAFHHLSYADCPLKPGTDGENYHDLIHLYDKSQPETLDFLRRLRALTNRYPGSFMVGEVYDDRGMELAKSYSADDTLLQTAYHFALFDKPQTAASLQTIFKTYDELPGDAWPSWPLSNHDVSRAVSRWAIDAHRYDPNPARAKQLNALLALLPGTVILYQGEELGLPDAPIPDDRIVDPAVARGSGVEGRDPCRAPMPWGVTPPLAGFSTAQDAWLPMPATYPSLSVDAQEADSLSTLNVTRALIAWRKLNRDLTALPLRFFDALPEPLFAFQRDDGQGRQLTALFNLAETDISLVIDDPRLLEALGHQAKEAAQITMPAYGVKVITHGFTTFPSWGAATDGWQWINATEVLV
ncbi:MAG: alpha-amylase family glycosyl hydrolase [Pseudomonadota bacterium]